MPCLNHHEVSQFLLGTLPGDTVDESERHLLQCDRCVSSADQADASDPLVEALQAAGGGGAEEDERDQSAISSLIERLGGLAAENHAASCTQEELDQILSPPESDDEIGRLAHYRTLEVLGAGGMGIVFKAEDVELERVVALKVMRPALAANPQAKRRFRREALAAAAFEHENIVTIYRVEEERGVPFFSMQWLEGESLRARLRRSEKLPVAEALRVTREIATGLAAAHARGLLHRDIKPDNIWLQADPFRGDDRVKIVDFGLVRSLDEPSSLTHSGMILGTPQYMAPEQACGEEVDARSDLFSVGCVLYQMLTGRPPFVAPNVVATLVAVSKAEVTPPHVVDSNVPRRASDLTMRLLAREPASRIASAAELAREAADLEPDLPKLQAAPARPPRRKRFLFGALAAGLAALVLGIIAVQTNHGTLVIEADDDVAVLVEGDAVELHDKVSGKRYELRIGENPVRPGEYEIVSRDPESGLEFSSREFAIHRGDRKSIRVALQALGSSVTQDRAPPPKSDLTPDSERRTPFPRGTAARSPNWLGDVEDSLGIEPGEPLSPLALVREPAAREDATSWTIETAEPRGAVHHAVYSPDGERVAAAGADGAVRIFRTDDRPVLTQVFVCPGPIARLAWSHNGEFLATTLAPPAASICVWRLVGEHVEIVSKINREAREIAWSPNDRQLAFSNNGVQLWDLATKTVLPNFGMTGEISSRPWSADGRHLASSTDGKIHVWDLAQQRLHATIGDSESSPPVYATVGNFIAYVDVPLESDDEDSRPTDRYFHVWDVDKNQRVKHFPLESGSFDWSWSPDGTTAVVLKRDELAIWDVRTGQETVPRARIGEHWRVNAQYTRRLGNWSSDAVRLVLTHYGTAYVWDVEANESQRLAGPSTELLADRKGDVIAVRAYHPSELTPNGYYFSTLDVWNSQMLERTLSMPHLDAELFQLSPNGRMLAVVGPQQPVGENPGDSLTLSIFNAATGEPISEGEHAANPSLGATWSPDGTKLMLRQLPNVLLVVAADSGDVIQTLTGPPRELNRWSTLRRNLGPNMPDATPWQGAWSPDGTQIAWYGEIDGVTISDVETGETVRVLRRPPNADEGPRRGRRGDEFGVLRGVGAAGSALSELVWSPDGRRITVRVPRVQRTIRDSRRYSTGTILVWDLDGSADLPSVNLDLDRVWSSDSSFAELAFTPSGEQLVVRHGKHVLIYDAASGAPTAQFEVEELAEIVGWIEGTDRFVARLEKPDRQWGLAVYDMHGDNTPLHEISIPEGSAEGIDGAMIYVTRSNVIETYNPTLTLQSTSVFEHRNGYTRIVRVDSDGQVHGGSSEAETVAVVLEQAGQRIVPRE